MFVATGLGLISRDAVKTELMALPPEGKQAVGEFLAWLQQKQGVKAAV